MSRQLAISACLSVFAMTAFVLFADREPDAAGPNMLTGAEAVASAPALDRLFPTGLIDLK